MCGSSPSVPVADPAGERIKAQAEATKSANAELAYEARQKRIAKGLTSLEAEIIKSGRPAGRKRTGRTSPVVIGDETMPDTFNFARRGNVLAGFAYGD